MVTPGIYAGEVDVTHMVKPIRMKSVTILELIRWKDPCLACLHKVICHEICGEKNKFTFMRPKVVQEKRKDIFLKAASTFAAVLYGVSVSIAWSLM